MGLRATSASDALDQVFAMIDVQIGTATVQEEIVGNCGDCHEGTNGKMYLHHIAGSSVRVLSSGGATALGLAVGTTVPVMGGSYASNDLRVRVDPHDDDPRITRTATEIRYQLDGVAGLRPGTYSVWVEVGSSYPVSWVQHSFQVGTATAEPLVATNCIDCHEDTRMHAGYFAVTFDPDICRSCHDHERQLPGRVGWASAGSNMGYGAAPLSRRIHGVHRGHYLDKPAQVHASYDYSEVIFPQDIRNCTTCHSESSSWTENPVAGRLPGLSRQRRGHRPRDADDPRPDPRRPPQRGRDGDLSHLPRGGA